MDPVQEATLEAGRGLVGNANQGGKRQVTLLSAEAWSATEAELGTRLDPSTRRANLLVSGIDLEGARGRTLRIGSCRILIHGETRPCRLMEESHEGLRGALDPDWRGGAFGAVLDSGEIRAGDPVAWEAVEAD